MGYFIKTRSLRVNRNHENFPKQDINNACVLHLEIEKQGT